MEDHLPQSVRVERRPVSERESRSANGPDWDRYADEYQATHGAFLGDAGFVWGPEGLTEDELGVLGDVAGLDVLEVGLRRRPVLALGAHPRRPRLRPRPVPPPAAALAAARRGDRCGRAVGPRHRHRTCPSPTPASTSSSRSFGALQFVSDIDVAVAEAARVLRPGGRFAFSITHPTRWMFPDDPGEAGLIASQSYWDRTPYVEVDDATGVVAYVEHHRTLGDWVRLLAGAGFGSADLSSPSGPRATTGCGAAGHAPAAC